MGAIRTARGVIVAGMAALLAAAQGPARAQDVAVGQLVFDWNAGTGLRSQVFEPLMNMASGGEIYGVLSRNVVRADDGTVVVTLLDGVTFHDGAPLTADDAIASIEAWAARTRQDGIAARAIDQSTFALSAATPHALVRVLTGAPIVRGPGGRISADVGIAEAIGTGAFQPVEFKKDELLALKTAGNGRVGANLPSLTLRRVPEFGSRLQALRSGGAIVVEGPRERRELGGSAQEVRISRFATPWTNHLIFGGRDGPFEDRTLRRALARRLSLTALDDDQLAVLPADTVLDGDLFANQPRWRALDDAGLSDDDVSAALSGRLALLMSPRDEWAHSLLRDALPDGVRVDLVRVGTPGEMPDLFRRAVRGEFGEAWIASLWFTPSGLFAALDGQGPFGEPPLSAWTDLSDGWADALEPQRLGLADGADTQLLDRLFQTQLLVPRARYAQVWLTRSDAAPAEGPWGWFNLAATDAAGGTGKNKCGTCSSGTICAQVTSSACDCKDSTKACGN